MASFAERNFLFLMPIFARLLQTTMGLSCLIAAFDIYLGCSGYIYGFTFTRSMIESGMVNSIIASLQILVQNIFIQRIVPSDVSSVKPLVSHA